MAGDADNPSLVVQKHVRGDRDGGDLMHGMRPHCIHAVMMLMARIAYIADVVAE